MIFLPPAVRLGRQWQESIKHHGSLASPYVWTIVDVREGPTIETTWVTMTREGSDARYVANLSELMTRWQPIPVNGDPAPVPEPAFEFTIEPV